MSAVSLNYRDLMVADGWYAGERNPPIVACSDMAGVVVEVGSEVTDVKVGDRVLHAPFRCWPAGAMDVEWAKTFVGGSDVDGMLAQQIIYPKLLWCVCRIILPFSKVQRSPLRA